MSTPKRKKDANQAGNGGEFAARTHDDAEASLDADSHPFRFVSAEEEPPYIGAVVRHLDRVGCITKVDEGGFLVTFADGVEELVTADKLTVQQCSAEYLYDQSLRRVAIQKISSSLSQLEQQERDDMAVIANAINDGAWGDLRHAATSALIDAIESDENDDWLVENAYTVHETGYHLLKDAGEASDSDFAAAQAALVTARALAARHLIGKVPGWTQEGYDHLTRPWRTCWGFIHEDDELAPASWAKRPLDNDALRRMSQVGRNAATNYAIGAHYAAGDLSLKSGRR